MISPKVADAIATVVAPTAPAFSNTGPKAPAVPCPPTIGTDAVESPISGFNLNSFAKNTPVKS
ncbi:hypothetical protein SDC9_136859 [bioreactor metagenome]|uniref:Uncharacterized protein n=1 Tax=bioreactor metagenome TaxID=1076179 RepID=A0A645DKF2_9ZZZZ